MLLTALHYSPKVECCEAGYFAVKEIQGEARQDRKSTSSSLNVNGLQQWQGSKGEEEGVRWGQYLCGREVGL